MAGERHQSAEEPGCLEIFTLGRFVIKCGDQVISERGKRSKKLWDLFKYLLIHQDQLLPPEVIVEALWPEQETVDPKNALHSLFYRLRRLFQQEVPQCLQTFSIGFSRGSYCFRLSADAWWDAAQFSRLSREAAAAADDNPPQARELYRQALALYRGHFLPENSSEKWVLPTRHYYRRVFQKDVIELVSILKDGHCHAEIHQLCEEALSIDPFLEEEAVHLAYMEALAADGKTGAALRHFEYISGLLSQHLGAAPSATLRDLQRLLSTEAELVELELASITEKLRERKQAPGPLQADRDFFRLLYRLEMRRAERDDRSVLMGLLTIYREGRGLPAPNQLEAASNRLRKVLSGQLRRGDTYCQWNQAQFLVLLPGLGPSCAAGFLQRLEREFANGLKHEELDLHSQLQSLLPRG